MTSKISEIKNEWKIIKLADLPDGEPVIAASEYQNKSLADFHLVTHVLYPLDGDWQFVKEAKKSKKK